MNIMKKISLLLTAFVLALTSCEVIEEPFSVGAESEKEILSFYVDTIEGLIDYEQNTVTLVFPDETDLSQLTPTIMVSQYATVSPASGVAQDFTQPLVYKVTAYDGSTADYLVSATFFNPEDEKSILSFYVLDPLCEGVINEGAKTITLFYPLGADVTHLVPMIEVSEGATVTPASGEPQDFTEPVEYTVTALNGTTTVYTARALVPWAATGKTVLLHDYTGVRCVNCPAASELAHELQDSYGERLVVLSVHAGFLAQPVGDFPDFTTEEGTEWYNNNSSNPLGSVNRAKLLPGYTLQSSAWADAVASAFEETQIVEIRVENSYNETTRQLTTTINACQLEDYYGNLSITVCLMEDGIIGKQVAPGGVVNDYVHRHVFRTTLNGAYGDDLDFEDGYGLYTNTFKHILPETYNADNCYIIAYVYSDTDDMKILQTAISKVK